MVSALSFAATVGANAAIPVLVYHRFDADKPAAMSVRTSTFRAQLDWLKQHGYRIVALKQALSDLTKPDGGDKEAVITVDDGNRSVYTLLYPLIRAEHLPVTLFIYPSAISNASYALTWDQLREMQASGLVAIQSHTYWHPNFKVERRKRADADYKTFVDEQLVKSRNVLEAKLGGKVDMIAWPYGIVDGDLEAAAAKAGYRFAFAYSGGSMRPGQDPLVLPRIPVPDVVAGFAAQIEAIGGKPGQ